MSYVTSFERIAEKRGVQQGVQQGKVSGRAEMLLKLLALKFGDLPSAIESKVSHARLEELDLWAERVLTAETLDDVFA